MQDEEDIATSSADEDLSSTSGDEPCSPDNTATQDDPVAVEGLTEGAGQIEHSDNEHIEDEDIDYSSMR